MDESESLPPAIINENKKRIRHHVKAYKNQLKYFVLTSRFNTQTWNENLEFRKTHPKVGCIYSSPTMITTDIPIDNVIFMLEMNNDTNTIMGIGMIRNHPTYNKYRVYDSGNYNRYAYLGRNRIDREEMSSEEETIMRVFDILCFKGNRHMKRGNGLKLFPLEMLRRCAKKVDLVDFIYNMFSIREKM
jgi:hypothetical protein